MAEKEILRRLYAMYTRPHWDISPFVELEDLCAEITKPRERCEFCGSRTQVIHTKYGLVCQACYYGG